MSCSASTVQATAGLSAKARTAQLNSISKATRRLTTPHRAYNGGSLCLASSQKKVEDSSSLGSADVSRRALNGMLGGAVLSATWLSAQRVLAEEDDDEVNPNLPVFDADGRVVSTADGNTKAEVLLKPVDLGQGASYMVPTIWKEVRAGTGWDDPVGGPQVQEVKLFTSAAAIDDISKLGRIEYVKLKNLPVPEELYAADVVGLKKETRDGMLFYEWDLAISPKECGMQQTLVQGVCFPDKVVLLSACVINGKFYVLQVTTNEEQWKLGSKAIKALRKTFSVA